jgi:hypothetical protein
MPPFYFRMEPVFRSAGAEAKVKRNVIREFPHSAKTPPEGGALLTWRKYYNVDSISKPQASSKASGIYLEFLLRRAHSRRRVDLMNWSGGSLNSFVICSKEVTVGTTGPMGSGLPQFGFPRRFAIDFVSLKGGFYPVTSSDGVGLHNCPRNYVTYSTAFLLKNQ